MSINSVIPVFVPHLGCNNNCIFCNQRKITGAFAPDGQAVREIIEKALLIQHSAPPEVAFYGGSFTAVDESLQVELLETAFFFVKSGEVSHVRVSTRPDAIDSDVLSRLKKYGVHIVELGAQSMDNEVLNLSKRGHDEESIVTSSKMIKNAGFSLILQMMTGLPGDSRDKDIMTAQKIAKLCPDGVRIYPVVVIRDTELFEMYQAGTYSPPGVLEACETAACLIEIFENADIPIIRVGLNPNGELSGGGAVAGAYHPALGQMAYSKVYLKKAKSLIENAGIKRGALTVFVNSSCVSLMIGQKRENMIELQKIYPQLAVVVSGCKIKRGTVVIHHHTDR